MTSSLRASTTGSGGFIGTSDASGTLGVIADAGIVDASTAISAMNMPVGTTAQRPVSPTTGASRYNTTLAQYEVYNGTTWVTGFQNITASYLVVGGGGGGGGSYGGGGGAGGYIAGTTPLATNVPYVITIGAGGAGAPYSFTNQPGYSGNSSVILSSTLSVTSLGGGTAATSGGSGGGGGGGGTSGGYGTYGQGNAGGTGAAGANFGGGGGGGAGASGYNGTTSSGGNGGNGTTSTISGASVTYAGGGGGGIYSSGSAGAGGTGGGGAGSATTVVATAGTTNSGGGGGGGYYYPSTGYDYGGGNGGSGVAIVSYSGLQQFNSPVATYNYTGGYSVHTFPTSGTLTYSPTKLLYNSLRFRASNSAYLSRTNASSVTNNAVWTWSGWVKIGYWSSGNAAILFGNGVAGGANESSIKFVNNQLNVINYVSSSVRCRYITNAIYVDPSAWYHIVVSSNSSTSLKIYINGVQVTSFNLATAPDASAWALNTAATATNMGYLTSAQYFDGYMAEVNFVDGQALTPQSFGAYNVTTGVWQPIAYTGTYGLNGFYTPFNDNSSVTALGLDYSGNRNNWTPNNFSLTAGTTYDYMLDSPTLTSATVGNYPTANPLAMLATANYGTLSNANLTHAETAAAGTGNYLSTMAIAPNSGKFYFEITANVLMPTSFYYPVMGLFPVGSEAASVVGFAGYAIQGIGYYSSGAYYINAGTLGTGTAISAGQTRCFAYDSATGKLWARINGGAWENSGNPVTGTNPFATLNSTYSYYPCAANYTSTSTINYGQQPFLYTPPSGFSSLNAYNLPTSAIVQPNKYFDINLYSGDDSSSHKIVDAAGFLSDFVWIKNRTTASQHVLTDSVRGVTKQLFSALTNAEQTSSTGITSLNTNGFTLGTNVSPVGSTNSSPDTFVAYQWQAGQGTTTTNNVGNLASTVSVNTTAGFSIVAYTGTGATSSGVTIGHGLGATPVFVITKKRSGGTDYGWSCWHTSLGGNYGIWLNLSNARNTSMWAGYTNFSSTVFSPPDLLYGNESGATYINYLFAAVPGYSAFGSYTGNGSASGPFVYTGFRVRYVLIKCSTAVGDWYIFDNARGINGAILGLITDNNQVDANYTSAVKLLSNGFSIGRTDAAWNSSGATYIYAAFADNPFKYGLAQ
jgi:hypothetical protein